MKVQIKDKNIPRNKHGDPHFEVLGLSDRERWPTTTTTLLQVFTPEEVVELVNRALYQLEYQRESHKRRSQDERDRLAPIKEKFKELYPKTSFLSATQEQIDAAIKAVKEDTTGS